MADETVQPPVAETPILEPDLSLADHEASFGEPSKRPSADPEPDGDEDIRRPARDDKGKFVNSPRVAAPKSPAERRSASHVAGATDVPRIQELTRRLRETERERDALKAAPAPPAAAAQPAQPQVPVPQPRPSEPARPNVNEFDDYEKYLDARDAYNRYQWNQEQEQRASAERFHQTWQARAETAKAKYDDFDAVVYEAQTTPIPPGSLIDAWIVEHKAGPDVVYHLHKHPEEVQQLLALPLFEQVDALSLLSQRLTTSPRSQAAPTGAAVGPQLVHPAPRPPTPVRTAPQRAEAEPPGDDASLADHEKYWGQRRRA